MYILKASAGIGLCFLGGWLLAGVLDDGAGPGEGVTLFSRDQIEWRASCTQTAQREWKTDFVSQHEYNAGILTLRQQGCNPRSAPSGLIPNVADGAADSIAEDAWEDEIAEQYADEDWPE